jgi:glycosyltransferase involved in cell wall biosynthesis
MRLAVVTHNIIKGDGQGRANYEIVRHALRNGVEVTLIADRVQEDLEKDVRWIKVQPKIRNNWLMHGLDFVGKANKILDVMQGEFDVIHGYGYCLDRPHHINTSQFVHSAWRQSSMHPAKTTKGPYAAYQWTYSAVNAWGEKRAYQHARMVVAASNTVRRELLQIGVPEKHLEVILNGADLDEFKPGPADRKKLGLPEGVPLGLFAGDIKTGRKNLDTVLKALTKTPEVHLAVVGRAEGSPFPAMAESLGLKDRVHFLDFRRDIADIMRAADMFVFPSRYEACALVLIEALASGLPIITAKSTGGSEAVTDECGIRLDNADDADAMAKAIGEVAGDTARRKKMSEAARETSYNYSWEKIADAYLQLYREHAAR